MELKQVVGAIGSLKGSFDFIFTRREFERIACV